jgi:hypothetical protein
MHSGRTSLKQTRPMRSGRITLKQGLITLAVAVAVFLAAWGWEAANAPAEGPNQYTLSLADYSFTPNHMTWRVGQHITLTMINHTQSHPGKEHEFVMGREPFMQTNVFGTFPSGNFKIPFFKEVTIDIISGHGLTAISPGPAKLTGMNPQQLLLPADRGPQPNPPEFNPVFAPGGEMTISFTVPNELGTWTYACFQQNSQHYMNGMHGTLTVLPASAS